MAGEATIPTLASLTTIENAEQIPLGPYPGGWSYEQHLVPKDMSKEVPCSERFFKDAVEPKAVVLYPNSTFELVMPNRIPVGSSSSVPHWPMVVTAPLFETTLLRKNPQTGAEEKGKVYLGRCLHEGHVIVWDKIKTLPMCGMDAAPWNTASAVTMEEAMILGGVMLDQPGVICFEPTAGSQYPFTIRLNPNNYEAALKFEGKLEEPISGLDDDRRETIEKVVDDTNDLVFYQKYGTIVGTVTGVVSLFVSLLAARRGGGQPQPPSSGGNPSGGHPPVDPREARDTSTQPVSTEEASPDPTAEPVVPDPSQSPPLPTPASQSYQADPALNATFVAEEGAAYGMSMAPSSLTPDMAMSASAIAASGVEISTNVVSPSLVPSVGTVQPVVAPRLAPQLGLRPVLVP